MPGVVRLMYKVLARIDNKPGSTHIEHAIDVVHITMFPSSMVDVILGHGNLRAVEDRGLRRER